MSHLDNPTASTVVKAGVGSTNNRLVWLVPLAAVVFPTVKYWLALNTASVATASGLLLVAYFLAIYLYKGCADLVREGRWRIVLAAGIAAAIIGAAVADRSQAMMAVANCVMAPAAGIWIGSRARTEENGLRLYLGGLTVVVIGAVAMFASQWGTMMEMAGLVGDEFVAEVTSTLASAGYHEDVVATSAGQVQQAMKAVIRILPAATIMGPMAQYSIGCLWFLTKGGPDLAAKVAPFRWWKAPFALTPILIVIILVRLVGGDLMALVADNMLVGLALCYLISGLAFVEWSLSRLKLTLAPRLLLYFLLTLTGLVGGFLILLVGFADSFADWRKSNREELELNER